MLGDLIFFPILLRIFDHLDDFFGVDLLMSAALKLEDGASDVEDVCDGELKYMVVERIGDERTLPAVGVPLPLKVSAFLLLDRFPFDLSFLSTPKSAIFLVTAVDPMFRLAVSKLCSDRCLAILGNWLTLRDCETRSSFAETAISGCLGGSGGGTSSSSTPHPVRSEVYNVRPINFRLASTSCAPS